jgi:probable F420-dependent oxidoreductase
LVVTERVLDEVGYYLLAGAGGEGPATLMDEARRGEELGFGTAFISERWNAKDASSLVGAACAVTNRMQIATAATNHNTRHPLITGSWATTMHRLSGGRFTLGIGRGVAAMYGAFGIPAVTTAQMEDFAQVMRRLWRGEVIFNHDGPIGKYQVLFLDPDFKENIRLALVAFGPNTLALGGRAFDDVILHTYFTPETLQRCVKTVKVSAEKAGRDPDSVRVWSCFATVGDHLPEELRLKKTVARLATYLQATAISWWRQTSGTPQCCGASGRTQSLPRSRAESTTRPPLSRSSRSRLSFPTNGWSRWRQGRRSSASTASIRSSTTGPTR